VFRVYTLSQSSMKLRYSLYKQVHDLRIYVTSQYTQRGNS